MKQYFLITLLLLSATVYSQQNLKHIRTKSWQTYIYKISAADAEQFIKWDSIPVSRYTDTEPFVMALADSVDTDSLPVGHYVEIRVIENNVQAWVFNNTNLLVLTINNKNNLQLDVRTKTGQLQTTATAFLKGRQIPFNNSSKTFWIKQHNLDEKLVKICTADDTTFIELAGKDDQYRTIGEQRRQNYRSTKIYRILNWLPYKIKGWLTHRRKYKSSRIGAQGYIIFNQPKYKPLDTVKFKGYAVDKKWRQYNKTVQVYLAYYNKGENINTLIKTLQPVSDGAFTGEFVLADTIPSDISCTLYFKTKKGKEIIRNTFKIEDYLLDEMGSFSFTANKETVYRNDSIHFTAAAKDANSLHVMDATATLVITATAINKFFKDTVYVADTLYYEEKKLLTTADTKFSFYTKNLPAADISLTAKLIFKTSNNELHEETETFNYAYETSNIIITQQADSIKAVLMINGVAVAATGEIEMNDEPTRKIQFPYIAKIDPVAAEYTFYYKAENNKLTLEIFEIEENYHLDFNRTSRNDTVGFKISNPNKIPVYYTVFFGKEIISTGKSSNAVIEWQHKMKNYRRAYKVRWQYIWAGEEKAGEETIGLFYKLLDIKINTSDKIFPGQKDTVKVLVKDYMGRPAENVNLTAVSYNNQFNKDIRVPQPPYLARYKGRKYLQHEGFENDGDYLLSKKYLLGNNKKWITNFHLDSMPYYKLLFPANGYYDAVTLTDNVLPQLSVTMVQNGVPQEIYLLYINRQLVYYNGVTDKMPYSFETMPENVQLRIRLKDKIIEVDSLYMQPHYKHDISIDINNLPPHSKIITAEKWWSYSEMNLLENCIWQMKDDYSNNNAYLWQYNRVVKLSGNRKHIAGPFLPNNTLTFFNPASFDINFPFEPGYEYSFSKQISRLEKMQLFPRKDVNNYLPDYAAALKLGDTIAEPPAIKFAEKKATPYLKTSLTTYQHQHYASYINGRGRMLFSLPKDTAIKYIVLNPENSEPLILSNDYGYNNKINNLTPGKYSLYLVSNNFSVAAIKNISVIAATTTCIKIDKLLFETDNTYINDLYKKAMQPEDIAKPLPANKDTVTYSLTNDAVFMASGDVSVTGKITDNKGGNPVPFASVKVKGSKLGISADANGNYSISKLRNGKHILEVAGAGYVPAEVTIMVTAGSITIMNVQLKVSTASLKEVVVTSAFNIKKSITGSITTINARELDINNALQGKVAGIVVRGQSTVSLDAETIIRLGGETGLITGPAPLYVIDGILYDKAPANLNPADIEDYNVLQGTAAAALYGSRGANGVILITTKTKTQRTVFRDYAFWKPNFFTNKNGEATFEVQYPDNITGWRTFVVGMDKKRRGGKASFLTQSFKPITAQLALPQFLLEGDTATILGKAKNYTADAYTYNSQFTINGKEAANNNKTVNGNEALIDELAVSTGSDTLTVNYRLQTTTGFKDGEQKKIPVFKKGTEETVGSFWVLQKDTTVHYKAAAAAKEITLYAQNNTLDVLLDEIEHLKKYPYYCMEQTASKLTGYAMEKKIKQQLQQPFANEKEMNRLLVKLQKTQQFDGGWPWWESGKSNFYISNYVANTLLAFRETPLVETNVRNAFLYLQNQLPYLKRTELLAALVTLNNGKHAMNYEEWMSRIHYDSLNQHQQWQWVKIMQGQNLPHEKELQKLLQRQTGTMLGGIHWGEDTYSWYSNCIATTVLAFEVLQNEKDQQHLLPHIIQYFLERRKTGYWRNTVESASILNAVLPTILAQQKNFTDKAVLQISGDTVMQIATYPYQVKLNSSNIKNLQVTKTGGGMVYFTAYEKQFNPAPQPVDSNFKITTWFEKGGQTVNTIKAGEKVNMKIKVEVKADAQYVMLQMPIPAGCNYAAKKQDWNTYREFYKDKMMLFTEALNKGTHYFEIELEPRYKGTYTLNPAKAELMYFPVFYGRNEMKKVQISE